MIFEIGTAAEWVEYKANNTMCTVYEINLLI